MGQHTWFEKDKILFKEEEKLWEKLAKHDSGEEWLDELEILQINARIDEIGKLNRTDHHDAFRTSKRNPDNTYTDDVIYSKEECAKWLEENSQYVSQLRQEQLDRFWEEFPNGVIYFG